MAIVFENELEKINKDELTALYGGSTDYYDCFERSYLKLFALVDNKLVGAVRILSEGVETALLVDLAAVAAQYAYVKELLLKEIEKKLVGRRVMVYGKREDLALYEALGYGRCKNAWTFFRNGFNEKDFLPAGYKYENEFVKYSTAAVNEPKNAEIVYLEGYGEACYNDINNLLTKAFFGRPHDINKTKEAFKNSRYTVTAYDGDKLVGIARAVSDERHYANILNVAVDPEYQGLSIGKKVVMKLSEVALAEVVVLNTHPGAVGFYNKLREYRRNKYVFEKHIAEGERKPMDPERMGSMFTPSGYRFPDEY